MCAFSAAIVQLASPEPSDDSDSCRTPVPICDTTTPECNSRAPIPMLLASWTGSWSLVCIHTCKNTGILPSPLASVTSCGKEPHSCPTPSGALSLCLGLLPIYLPGKTLNTGRFRAQSSPLQPQLHHPRPKQAAGCKVQTIPFPQNFRVIFPPSPCLAFSTVHLCPQKTSAEQHFKWRWEEGQSLSKRMQIEKWSHQDTVPVQLFEIDVDSKSPVKWEKCDRTAP